MAFDIGQKVRLPVAVADADGTPTAAAMAVVITRPDGTVFPAGAVVQDAGVGNYHVDVTTDGTNWGPWLWTFTASGAVVAVYSGQFFVRAPGPRIVSLEEVKHHLNKSLDVHDDDEELRDWIDATRWVIENIKGVVVPRTFVEYHDGGGRQITLRRGPVISVAEVRLAWGPGDVRVLTAEADDMVGATVDQYLLHPQTRRLLHRNGGWTMRWPYGQQNIRATYRAGRIVPEDNIRQASKELIGHFWRQSQLATGNTRPRADAPDPTSMAYGVPNRVRELLGTKRAPRLGG